MTFFSDKYKGGFGCIETPFVFCMPDGQNNLNKNNFLGPSFLLFQKFFQDATGAYPLWCFWVRLWVYVPSGASHAPFWNPARSYLYFSRPHPTGLDQTKQYFANISPAKFLVRFCSDCSLLFGMVSVQMFTIENMNVMKPMFRQGMPGRHLQWRPWRRSLVQVCCGNLAPSKIVTASYGIPGWYSNVLKLLRWKKTSGWLNVGCLVCWWQEFHGSGMVKFSKRIISGLKRSFSFCCVAAASFFLGDTCKKRAHWKSRSRGISLQHFDRQIC